MAIFPQKVLPTDISERIYNLMLTEDEFGSQFMEMYQRYLGYTERPGQPLTREERIHGLATIWSEAKFGFAYWDQLPGHAWWDEQFQRFLPLVAEEQDDSAYYQLLLRFGALLADGHTGVIPPRHLMASETAVPPLQLRAVEGRPIVEAGDALPAGSEILTVDGRPWQEVYAEKSVRVHSSREEFTLAVTVARLLLRGPEGSAVQLTACTPAGEHLEVTLERTGGLPERPPLLVHDLGGGLLHVEVNRMDTEETWQQFDAYFADFEGVTGLILDVRWNGGGSSHVGWKILSRILSEPAPSAAVQLPAYLPTMRAWGVPQRWLTLPGKVIVPSADLPRFTGPVCFLSSLFTFSAAEDFLVIAKESRRGPLIGEPSGGSTGQPLMVELPGGGLFRACSKRDTHPDGTVFCGPGVQPDIACAPSLAGVAAGRDEVLERAVQYIRTGS